MTVSNIEDGAKIFVSLSTLDCWTKWDNIQMEPDALNQ